MYAPPVHKGCQAFMRAQEWSFFMKQMSKTEIVSVGLMMFSIFFGAGNLIFPPALGQSAGENLLPAMGGFLLTGIGLPLLGIVAIALAGGDYVSFMGNRVSKKFAGIILGLLYLTIGPLFAVPRTGAVSFEIGIRPFLEWEQVTMGQGIYTAVFFLLTFWLALNPSKLVDRVGKTLTPALLLFLVVVLYHLLHI
jgi:LIVCS family branched-chain amino acid:cation transporter